MSFYFSGHDVRRNPVAIRVPQRACYYCRPAVMDNNCRRNNARQAHVPPEPEIAFYHTRSSIVSCPILLSIRYGYEEMILSIVWYWWTIETNTVSKRKRDFVRSSARVVAGYPSRWYYDIASGSYDASRAAFAVLHEYGVTFSTAFLDAAWHNFWLA